MTVPGLMTAQFALDARRLADSKSEASPVIFLTQVRLLPVG